MGKRKRDQDLSDVNTVAGNGSKKKLAHVDSIPVNGSRDPGDSISLQIITGSYDRILHGIIATIPTGQDSATSKVHFHDSFLFNGHASAIKCLAISPSSSRDGVEADKITLATGGTDEKINLYSISTSTPKGPSLPTLSSVPSLENRKNKELGALLHHNATVNVLYFPTRSKLISGSDDNTISISRTRDWTVLSTVKAPHPKVQGRPSGDTAPLGGAPAGITDFAVHPSMKLMISVGKGEKCMRLWNLVTGKKANVLNFEKDLLQSVGEGKWSRGEGQRVVWNAAGDEFAVAFGRGIAVFGMDSEVRCVAVPMPVSKVHQITYTLSASEGSPELLAISTEDGRILFYTTQAQSTDNSDIRAFHKFPAAVAMFYLGGKEYGVNGRIKDFHIISPISGFELGTKIIVTAGSDGAVMIWKITSEEIQIRKKLLNGKIKGTASNDPTLEEITNHDLDIPRVGILLAKYDTGNRITCMKSFELHGSSEDYNEDPHPDNVPVSEQKSSEDDTLDDEEEGFEGFQ